MSKNRNKQSIKSKIKINESKSQNSHSGHQMYAGKPDGTRGTDIN